MDQTPLQADQGGQLDESDSLGAVQDEPPFQRPVRPFHDLDGDGQGLASTHGHPMDIHEENDTIVLRAEIPGIKREDIELSVENGILTLRGEKKQEKQVESENAFRQERFYGSFVRSFVLPSLIDSDRIQATYRDGVLEVVVPKAEEAKPKKIKIVSGNGQAEKRVEERALRASS